MQAVTSKYKFDRADFQIGYPSDHLTCWRRSALIQKSPAQIPIAFTAQKMKFSIKDFSSKCDQIRRKLGHIYGKNP